MKEFIRLYSDCIPVKGYKQSIIYDLQRPRSSNLIPNDLYDILTIHSEKTVNEIKDYYKHQYDDIIDEYFDFLLGEDFAYPFYENELEYFPAIESIWMTPSEITNSIIYIGKFCKKREEKIITELSQLKCDGVQICFTDEFSENDIQILGTLLENTRILSVELLCNYNANVNFDNLIEYLNQYPRYQRVIIGNTPKKLFFNEQKINCIEDRIDFEKGCGIISSHYFSINMSTFYEAQTFNTCLNRKLCIDTEGNIKNCPTMQQNFDNIKDTNLQKAIEKPGFKDLWFIYKGQINVCKDCEFRHMCTDCRCFIKDPGNIYSQPAKCTYNPYICKWDGQEGYVPVEECGIYSKETGFVPDKEKIAELNKQILGKDDE